MQVLKKIVWMCQWINEPINDSSCRENKFIVLNTKQRSKNRDEEKRRKCLISSFSNLQCSVGRLKAHSQSCWCATLPQHCDPCLHFLRGTMASLSSSSSSSWIHHNITLFFSSDSAHSLRQRKGNICTSSWLKENHFPPVCEENQLAEAK